MKPYHILSLDDGGIRGLLSVALLEQARPGFLHQIDLFVGTSSSSILALALGLAHGLTPTDLRKRTTLK